MLMNFSVEFDDVESTQIGSNNCLKNLTEYTKRKLFILQWISTYSNQDFIGDLLAGITIGLTVIPQSMAMANIIGVPAQVPTVGLSIYLLNVKRYGIHFFHFTRLNIKVEILFCRFKM